MNWRPIHTFYAGLAAFVLIVLVEPGWLRYVQDGLSLGGLWFAAFSFVWLAHRILSPGPIEDLVRPMLLFLAALCLYAPQWGTVLGFAGLGVALIVRGGHRPPSGEAGDGPAS